ncbi:MAG: hypothetical protein P1U65_06800 [Minwuia sp.]|nr:hypothetical protein [Minwuia sp.]
MSRPEHSEQPKTLLERMNSAVYRTVTRPFRHSLLDETPDFDDYKPGKVEHFITNSSIQHAGRWSNWLTGLLSPRRAWGCLGLVVLLVVILSLSSQTRSTTTAIPCPTPIHMAQRA